jgi:YVTN family beta-propeller protein
VYVFDLETNARVAILGAIGGSGEVSLSPDESLALVSLPWAFGSTYGFYRTDDYSLAASLYLLDLRDETIDGGTGWSANGSHAFALRVGENAGDPSTLYRIDVAGFQAVGSMALPEDVVRPGPSWPWYLAIPPAGSRALVAAVGGIAHRVLLVDLDALAVVAAVDVGPSPSQPVFDETGRHAYIAAIGGDAVSVLDLTSAAVIATIPTDAGPSSVALDERRRLLAVGCTRGGTVRLFDLDTHAPLVTVPMQSPGAVTLLPHVAIALVPNIVDDSVRVVDLDPDSSTFGTIVQSVALPPCSEGCYPRSVELRPSGRSGYVLGFSSRINVLSLPLPPVSIDVIPDTFRVAAGSRLTLRATITNNASSAQTVDGWVDVILPSGREYHGNPVLGPLTRTLGVGRALSRTAGFRIGPGVRPSGPYLVRASVGSFPSPGAVHTASFRFFVE